MCDVLGIGTREDWRLEIKVYKEWEYISGTR